MNLAAKKEYYRIKACSDLGSKIYGARLSRNLSKEELAKRAGLDLETVKAIEEEGKISSTDLLYRMLDALALEIEFKNKDIFS